MHKRLLSHDPLTKIDTYHHYDPLTDETTISLEQDVEAVLEQNKMLKNDPELDKKGIKGGWWRYASIPVIWQYKLLAEKGIDIYRKEHAEQLSKLLEDPEYSHLKTTYKKHKFK